jgi:hypothetical protein
MDQEEREGDRQKLDARLFEQRQKQNFCTEEERCSGSRPPQQVRMRYAESKGERSAVRPPRKDGMRGRKVEAWCESKLSATVLCAVNTAVRMKEA